MVILWFLTSLIKFIYSIHFFYTFIEQLKNLDLSLLIVEKPFSANSLQIFNWDHHMLIDFYFVVSKVWTSFWATYFNPLLLCGTLVTSTPKLSQDNIEARRQNFSFWWTIFGHCLAFLPCRCGCGSWSFIHLYKQKYRQTNNQFLWKPMFYTMCIIIVVI